MSFAKLIFGATSAILLVTGSAWAQTPSAIGGGAQGSISSVNGITQSPDGVPYYAGRSAYEGYAPPYAADAVPEPYAAQPGAGPYDGVR